MRPNLIYLDNHSTTPCDPRVVEAMLPYFFERFGNASSPHFAGTRAHDAIEEAREEVAALLGARASEIIWASGATEANNLAILGLARSVAQDQPRRRRIVISALEHKAVLEPYRALQREGFEILLLPVERDGRINLERARELIDEHTLLVCVQGASGEIGTIQPIEEISSIARQVGAWMHCDAAQAVGKIPVDVRVWNVDSLALSGHKLYGPQGIGALYVRRGWASRLAPIQYGGAQERGLRPGTIPLALVVGLGAACHLCETEMKAEAQRLREMRDELELFVASGWPELLVNGAREARLPHNSSLTFPGLPADALLTHLPEIALSTGSACDSGAPEPSKTLQAIGLSRADASSTIRIGLGRFTTREEILYAGEQLIRAAEKLRSHIES